MFDFYQIQYLIHKYIYFLVFIQVFITYYSFIYLLKYQNKRIIKFSNFLVYIFCIFYIPRIRGSFFTKGWDRVSICDWVNLNHYYENFNIYTIQFPKNIELLNISAPQFSAYYHPFVFSYIEPLCQIPSVWNNFLLISIFIIIILYFSIKFAHFNFLNLTLLIFFSFNNIFWIFMSGQFILLEIIFLFLSLIFYKNKKHLQTIFFLTLFGIQRIYFLIFPLLIALKNKSKKSLFVLFTTLVIINSYKFNLLNDFYKFWFSNEGYILSSRKGMHSFLNENFDITNTSLLALINTISSFLNLNFTRVEQIGIYLILMFFLFLLFNSLIWNLKNDLIKTYIYLLLIILLFPLLKPYTYIFYTIICIFLLEEVKSNKLINFSIYLLVVPNLTYFLIGEFLFGNPNEIYANLKYFYSYQVLRLANFYTSWIHFITIIFYTKKKFI